MLAVSIGLIFLCSGLAISLDVSPLLANMMLGFVVINFVKHHEDIFRVVESLEEPIFAMFFVLAGAHDPPRGSSSFADGCGYNFGREQ